MKSALASLVNRRNCTEAYFFCSDILLRNSFADSSSNRQSFNKIYRGTCLLDGNNDSNSRRGENIDSISCSKNINKETPLTKTFCCTVWS